MRRIASSAGLSRSARTERYCNIERDNRSARRLGAGTAHIPSPKPPGPVGPASSPFSAVDLFQRLDRHLPLGNHAPELRVLSFEFAQPFHISGFELAEPPTPHIDCLLADLCFFETSTIGPRSASRRIATICSSVNRAFFISSSLREQGTILSSYERIEEPGQVNAATIHSY